MKTPDGWHRAWVSQGCDSSGVQHTQVQTPFAQRRAPVIATGNRPAEAIQAIDDAIVQTAHAPQLRLVSFEGMAERQEHQAGALLARPGHRAAHYEGLRGKALLGGTFDVSGLRRVVQ